MEDFKFCLARRAISALSLRAIRLAGQFFVVGGVAALLFLGASLTGGKALADCAPDPATEGDTVTCTGVDTDGFGDGSLDLITLDVTVGSEVSKSGADDWFATINLGDSATVTNDGTVSVTGGSSSAWAIYTDNDSNVTNNGFVLADGIFSGGGIRSGSGIITNFGTVDVSADFVADGVSGGVVNNIGDIISVAEVLAIGAAGADITNDGTIEAIVTGASGEVDGLYVGGSSPSLQNNGLVTAIAAAENATAYGVHTWSPGAIVNDGTIEALSGALGASTTGIIILDVSAGWITNNGLISSVSTQGNASGIDAYQRHPRIINTGTISVSAGGAAAGISGEDGSTIINDGTVAVVGTGTDDAVGISAIRDPEIKSTDSEITNNGTITVSGQGRAWGIVADRGSTTTNTGTIDVSGVGESIGIFIDDTTIFSTNGRTKTLIFNSGTIAADTAIEARTGPDSDPDFGGIEILDNSGTIDGNVLLGHGRDTIFNRAGGVINGIVDLGSGENQLTNEAGGLISSGGIVSTEWGRTFITNEGTITADIAIEDAFVTDPPNWGGRQIVTNSGTINGRIMLGQNDDSVTNTSTGVINGTVDLGSESDSLTNETGGLISAMDDAVIAKDDSTIVNAGTITSTYGVDPADIRTLAAAVTVGNDSDIQNTGTISVESELAIPFMLGVQVGNRNNVRNDGTISVVQSAAPPEEGWAVGVFTAGAANVTENNGQIDVSGPSRSVGIFSHSGGEVTNNGDISAVTENNVAIGIIGWEGHNIVNNGTVSADAGDGGAVAILTVGGASIVNSGTLTASNDGEDSEGIHVGGGSSSELVSITNTGSITAKTAIGSVRGIPSGASSNVVLENTGSITGDILFEGGDNTITNKSTGVISGTIDLGDGTNTLTNEAGGLISSEGNAVMGAEFTAIDNAGTISSTGSGWAIRVGENSEINNTGTISIATETATLFTSGVSLGGSTTVRNEGTITVEKVLDPADDDLMSGVGINAFEGGGNFLENNGRIEVGGTASAFGIYSLVGDEVINNGEIDVVSENRFAAGIVGIISGNTIINNGAISASTAGSSAGIATLGGATIVNNGTIEVAGGAGIARGVFVLSGRPDLVSIRNTGSITAETAIEAIKGLSSGVAANVALANTGTITGDILFEGGSNTVEFGTGSDVTGDLVGGDGTDVLTLSGDNAFLGAVNNFEEMIVTGGMSNFRVNDASTVSLTTVESGSLNLLGRFDNSALIGAVTVNAGAMLGGNSMIVGNVTNLGTVSPGSLDPTFNSDGVIGEFVIDGDYTQTADAVFSVQMSPAGWDHLEVRNTAFLDGRIEVGVHLTNLALLENQTYEVLSAFRIEGEFDNEGTTRQGFWDITVTRPPGENRYLVTFDNIDVPLGVSSPSVGALGGALASILGISSPASAQITELSSSSVQSQQITGQASANLATATIGNAANFNSAILGRLEDARFAIAAESVSASFTDTRSAPSWVGWVGYSFVSHFDREALERGARDNVLKFSGGADIALSPRARVGYALGLYSSDLDVSRFAGDNQVEGIQASAYGAYRRGKAFLNGVFGVANNRFELERKIDFGFVKESLSGETDGTDVNALVETGYDFSYRGVRVIPFASLQGVSSHREAYREDGGVFALNVAADTAYSLQSALGVKLGGNWTTDAGLQMSSRLKLAWAHEYLDHRRDVRVAFARLPEREFFLIGRGINRDALEIETEMGLRLTGQLNAVFKYRGLIGSRDTAHGITFGFNVTL